MSHKVIKDQYYRSRGSTASFIKIVCAKCKNPICDYQKDGNGNLHRLYVDRIVNSPFVVKEPIADIGKIPNLKCSCSAIIAVPMVYKREGRLAFRLIHGSINKIKIS